MFPGEMIILLAIATTGESGKKILSRPMDITGEYIGYLYDSLVNRGYLSGNRLRGYRLTATGTEALSEFLYENETRVKDTIKRLQKLGIDYRQEVGKLGKESLEVR